MIQQKKCLKKLKIIQCLIFFSVKKEKVVKIKKTEAETEVKPLVLTFKGKYIKTVGRRKTAIAEGLALRIVTGDVPMSLADKKVFALNVEVDLEEGSIKEDLEDEMLGHVIDSVQLIGVYQRE